MAKVLFRICFANFLLTAAVFMQLGAIVWGESAAGVGFTDTVWAVSAFVLGLFALGPVSSYFVAKYQRKSVFKSALLLIAVVSAVLYFNTTLAAVAVVRFVQGALCGLAQVALGSTMLNDMTASERRTFSDYNYSWSALLGIPVGVAAAYFLCPEWGFNVALLVSVAMLLLSILTVMIIKVPFRAPISVPMFSCDRFWQKNDFLPFVNLLLFSSLLGLFLSANFSAVTFLFVSLGVVVAHPLRRMIFSDADVRAEIVSGMLLVLAAVLIPFSTDFAASIHAADVIFGAGIGLGSSRFLLYFLKLTGHCQRGTAQNTYMLARDCGYAIGLVAGAYVENVQYVMVPVALVSLVFYLAITHPWFRRHNDRDFKFHEV